MPCHRSQYSDPHNTTRASRPQPEMLRSDDDPSKVSPGNHTQANAPQAPCPAWLLAPPLSPSKLGPPTQQQSTPHSAGDTMLAENMVETHKTKAKPF
mmetsp:Transcript_76576/g.127556  ORF Transcript_76576/g.127556 Transcript_76576/m.127556 type:complete len:97 (+) Transcript_76576:3705-3995(+)